MGNPLKCDQCDQVAKSPVGLKMHITKTHGKKGATAGKVKGVLKEAPADIKGTPKGDAIEILIETRQVNQDEVDRCNRAIAGILGG